MGGGGGGSSSFGRPSKPSGPVQAKPSAAPEGGGGGGPSDDCFDIDINLTLQSPQPLVVAGLQKGDVLGVQLTGGQPPILAVTSAGDTAGALVPSDIKKLADCINKGHKFVAEVLQIAKGAVTVRVHMELP